MVAGEITGRFVVAIHCTPQAFYAQVVNLPGCFAKGASEIEALENARAMIPAFVALTRLVARSEPRVRLEISA
jgi:predicted RNase H-like HicB family nuclease